jgi:adenylate kinase family enzyme
MTGIWSIILQVVLGFAKFFIKDESRKQRYEAEVKERVEEYERETKTSSEIREASIDTRKRLEERFKQGNNGNNAE